MAAGKWVCFDLDEATKYFGARKGTPEYDTRGWIFDVNGDDVIDARDIAWFSRRYGVAVHKGAYPISTLLLTAIGSLFIGGAIALLIKR